MNNHKPALFGEWVYFFQYNTNNFKNYARNPRKIFKLIAIIFQKISAGRSF